MHSIKHSHNYILYHFLARCCSKTSNTTWPVLMLSLDPES